MQAGGEGRQNRKSCLCAGHLTSVGGYSSHFANSLNCHHVKIEIGTSVIGIVWGGGIEFFEARKLSAMPQINFEKNFRAPLELKELSAKVGV